MRSMPSHKTHNQTSVTTAVIQRNRAGFQENSPSLPSFYSPLLSLPPRNTTHTTENVRPSHIPKSSAGKTTKQSKTLMAHKLGSKPNSATHPVTLGKLLCVSKPQLSYLQDRDTKPIHSCCVRKSSQHVLGAQCTRVLAPSLQGVGHSPSPRYCFLRSEDPASQVWTAMPGRPL